MNDSTVLLFLELPWNTLQILTVIIKYHVINQSVTIIHIMHIM